MAESNFRGPVNSMGSLEIESGSTATIEPMDGPSGAYQGYGMLDVRATFLKDGTAPARQALILSTNDAFMIDNIPQKAVTTLLAATQTIATTVGIPMSLATVGIAGVVAGTPSIAVAVPIIPQGTASVTNAIAIDFGFATGSTVAASSTVVVNDSTQFTQGQWIIIGNVGNAGATASTITQVQSIAAATTTLITVGPNLPGTALANAPIGQANLYGSGLLPPATQFGPSAPVANAHNPNVAAGFYRVHNPKEALARNVSISLVTAGVATAATFLVTGWDYWRQAMTELITVPATAVAVTVYGQKAFKYIASVLATAGGTTNQYSVGLGDTFGLPLRADEWEQTQIYWNGNSVATSAGFIKAVTTTPATNTTGDVRGTVQVSTAGNATAIASTAASNNTSRLVIVQNSGVWNIVNATPLNTVPMFGVPNA